MRLYEVEVLVGVEPDGLLASLVGVVALKLTGYEGHHTLPTGLADLLDPLAIHGEGNVGDHHTVSVTDNLAGPGIHDGPQPVPKVAVDLDRVADGEVWVVRLARIRGKGAWRAFDFAFHARDYRVWNERCNG